MTVARGYPRPGGGRDQGSQRGGDEHAKRGQAGEGAGRGLIARCGQDDAEVEARAGDGRAERGRGGEDAQVPQIRIRVEAGDTDLSAEGDELGQERTAQEGENLREDARAGGACRFVRHGLI